jgi:hypothetical protein
MMSKAALEEKELLRQFIMTRLQAGVDLRSIVVGQAAAIGAVTATSSPNVFQMEVSLGALVQVMRHNAQLEMPAAGNG